MYKFIYALVPKKYKQWVEKYINYCDFTISPMKFIGFTILFGLLFSFTIAFLIFSLGIISFNILFIVWIVDFVAFEVMSHGILLFVSDSRANFTEEILPDALQIISANMRSGLTPDKAILSSARPEFGPLEKELRKVAKEALSGKPLDEALKGITKKIRSRILEKTINLLIESMAKGGAITTLLDGIAEDLRQAKILKGEMRSYIIMYVIFIFFAACFGAPLLYSISTFLVETMARFGAMTEVKELPTTTNIPFLKFSVVSITPDFLITYSFLAIGITTIFGSLLIGLVQEGKESAGLKFIPLLLPLAQTIFFVTRLALMHVFSSLTV